MTPILLTERLVLRRPKASDWPTVRDFLISPRSAGIGLERAPYQAWQYYSSVLGHWEMCGYGLFTALSREDHRPVGFVGPWFPATWERPELGIHIFSDKDEGKGYAREAMSTMLGHVFEELNWPQAICFVAENNERHHRMLKRMGARRRFDIAPPNDPMRRTKLITYGFDAIPSADAPKEGNAND